METIGRVLTRIGVLTLLVYHAGLFCVLAHASEADEQRLVRAEYRMAVENRQNEAAKPSPSPETSDGFPTMVEVFEEKKLSKTDLENKCYSDYEDCLAKVLKKRKACAQMDDACMDAYRQGSQACRAVSEACGKGLNGNPALNN